MVPVKTLTIQVTTTDFNLLRRLAQEAVEIFANHSEACITLEVTETQEAQRKQLNRELTEEAHDIET